MTSRNWKAILGARLKELRERAHGGKGISQEKAAATIGFTTAYVNRLENKMGDENPSLEVLDKLVTLYGSSMADLFAPIAYDYSKNNAELKDKLDFILSSGVERTAIGISENIHAMFERTKKIKRQ